MTSLEQAQAQAAEIAAVQLPTDVLLHSYVSLTAWSTLAIAESLDRLANSLHSLDVEGIETYQLDGDGHRR